jgi:D-alanyl-D-alanine carboxypeptidase/D-alanyl-D-alanine-endopeptidase (penicillin-binding protein 4)
LHFAFCIFALLSCSKTSPTTAPTTSPRNPLEQLRREITQSTQTPGVQRGVWGIVVHSLDRNERLFDMQPGTLLVPALRRKARSCCLGRRSRWLNFQFETTLRVTGPSQDGVLAGDLLIVGSGEPDDRRPCRRGLVELACRGAGGRNPDASTAGSSATTTR